MAQENVDSNNKTQNSGSETLIDIEWKTIRQLEKMLMDSDLNVKERTSAANVLAFHVNTLNKLLLQAGGKPEFDEQNLGDYIIRVQPRMARQFRRDFKIWQRALSSRRY